MSVLLVEDDMSIAIVVYLVDRQNAVTSVVLTITELGSQWIYGIFRIITIITKHH